MVLHLSACRTASTAQSSQPFPLPLPRLASYAPVVNRAASRVADMLAPCADKDVPVDLYQLLQAMTMDVIGRCAFG